MAIGNTNGVTADIVVGGVYCPQRRGGQEVATKISNGIMYSKGDMVFGGSGDITTEGR